LADRTKLGEEHERAKLWKQLTRLAYPKKLFGGYNRELNKKFVKFSIRNLRSLTDFFLWHAEEPRKTQKLQILWR